MARKRITIRAVEALKPGEALWDTDVRGFGVRRQLRDPIYVLKYRFGGRQRFFTMGRHGGPWTPEMARKEAKRLLGLLGAGRDPAAVRDAAKATPTLAEFAGRYLADYAERYKKPRSVAEDRRNLRIHILPTLGRSKIVDLDRAAVARVHAGLKDKSITANRCLALVSHMMGMAERWGLRTDGSNPCRHVKKYPEKLRERLLKPEELARLGDALAQSETANWRTVAVVRLLIFTGARLSEVLGLQWDWIDGERCLARLPDSKTGAKNLALPTPALAVLGALPRFDGNPHVIPGDRAGKSFRAVHKPWVRIRAAAGLVDLRLHDLRHAFASVAVASGDSLYLVGRVLGHHQAQTTERYAHLAPDPVRAVADRTAQRIAAMLGGGEASGDVVSLRKPRK